MTRIWSSLPIIKVSFVYKFGHNWNIFHGLPTATTRRGQKWSVRLTSTVTSSFMVLTDYIILICQGYKFLRQGVRCHTISWMEFIFNVICSSKIWRQWTLSWTLWEMIPFAGFDIIYFTFHGAMLLLEFD